MLETVCYNLNKRGFIACCVKNKDEALKKSLEIINEDEIASFGGSESVKSICLAEALINRGSQILHRSHLKDGETAEDVMKKSMSADFFVCSANAVTCGGEIVNTDGTANRVAATLYGPKNILMIVGKNKITADLNAAFERIKNTAARLNCERLNRNNPCVYGGSCNDCTNSDTICNATVIHHHPTRNKLFYVVLVDEELGY
ncbi:MAG: lactate utilization protein [Christensenellales bacterium]